MDRWEEVTMVKDMENELKYFLFCNRKKESGRLKWLFPRKTEPRKFNLKLEKTTANGSRYSIMDQVKFVEDSL